VQKFSLLNVRYRFGFGLGIGFSPSSKVVGRFQKKGSRKVEQKNETKKEKEIVSLYC
jgi:hypothetical protein